MTMELDQKPATKSQGVKGGRLHPMVRKPRHRWFSAHDRKCDDGWFGPYKTIEEAAQECACHHGPNNPIYVGQGRKLTKAEMEEWGSEFDWQVDAQNAIEIRLPNIKTQMTANDE